MSGQDPEWLQKTKTHNAITVLNLARFAQPLVIFGILYWILGAATDFSLRAVIGLAALAAIADWLLLGWIIRKLKVKDNTIG